MSSCHQHKTSHKKYSDNLDGILTGDGIDEIVEALIANDQAAKLADLDA